MLRFADLLVGASKANNNELDHAYLFSGRTGALLYHFLGEEVDDGFGISVSGAEDVNRDGFDDIIVGAWRYEYWCGAAYVYGGNDLFLNATPKAGEAGDTITLTVREAPVGTPCALFFTAVNGNPSWGLVAIGSFSADESCEYSGSMSTGLAGMSLTLQAFAQSPTGKVLDTAPETVEFE